MGGRQSFPRVLLPKEHIVVITGGNQGIGYHTAKWIAMMGATVILACRSEERARQTITQMNEEYQDLKRNGTEKLADNDHLHIEFMKLDNSSLTSTMAFIENYKSSGRNLNTLICNAGIGTIDEAYTEDGNEKIFQVNYLSHFLIISHLLPIIGRSGEDGRIISVSSLAHRSGRLENQIQYKDSEGNYDGMQAYSKSKLYQVMHMYSLNRRIKTTYGNVTVNTLHPGIVETEILDTLNMCIVQCCFLPLSRCLGKMKTPFEGAWTSINAAVNPALKGHRDVYFDDSKPATTASHSRNLEFQERLWNYSLERLKDYMPDDVISVIEGKNS